MSMHTAAHRNTTSISVSTPLIPLSQHIGNTVTTDECTQACLFLTQFQNITIGRVAPLHCDELAIAIGALYRWVSWNIVQLPMSQTQSFCFFARTLTETLQVLSGMKAQCLNGRLCFDATGSYANVQARLQRIIRWICLLQGRQQITRLY